MIKLTRISILLIIFVKHVKTWDSHTACLLVEAHYNFNWMKWGSSCLVSQWELRVLGLDFGALKAEFLNVFVGFPFIFLLHLCLYWKCVFCFWLIDQMWTILIIPFTLSLVETFVWKCATTSGTPPSPRDSHTCSSWKNKIIVIGGEDGHDYYLSDVHILDTGINLFYILLLFF